MYKRQEDESLPPLARLVAFVDSACRGMTRFAFQRGCLVGNLGQEVVQLSPELRLRLEQILLDWEALLARCLRAVSYTHLLRLATSRSITSNGTFDLHTFSKIEIPVWQSYALGAGIVSKVAANFLSKRNNLWFNNIYKTEKADYFEAGGNGACMRIQPHVWSSATPNIPSSFLDDVIKNSLTTHGLSLIHI